MEKNAWKERDFCQSYSDNIQISTEDLHYGYLSPGERELHLLGPVSRLKNKWVVEIGCGAAHNCITLSKWGAKCTGIDISMPMIRNAKILAKKENVDIELICGDGKNLDQLLKRSKYNDQKVSIFISSYAISFICQNTIELINLFKSVRKNIHPRGSFVFCFSHPSQKPKKPIGGDNQGWNETYFTINEVTQSLNLAGFETERTLEQTTENPSKIPIEEKERFPYRIINLNPSLDRFTHKPHTIIYLAKTK